MSTFCRLRTADRPNSAHNVSVALTGFDKAIAAAILAAAGALVTAAQAGPLDTNSYIAAAVSGIVAGLAVYFKANAAAKATAGV